ncbi:hypothetical protein D8771_13745 [Streptomyces albus]|uniref:Uncharacterized protein n=1 Tax=Streptomyces albus TaxID=1888 RepID=A0A8H1LI64_9ACTN|nr:hypothetical protein ADL27_49755 [Streptomyces sp. NRRL F-6602]TGG83789.1 hypothetical protein D8771_13745 [Streptomyces albus]
MCRRAFQVAVDFGFVAVDAVADLLPQEVSLALVQRLGFCDCGRLSLDGDALTRSALSAIAAANTTACQGLVLTAIDYAHRTFGCAGLSALVHELTEGRRATFDCVSLSRASERWWRGSSSMSSWHWRATWVASPASG